MNDLYLESIELLEERGVNLESIKECVIFLQRNYIEEIEQIDIDSIIIGVLNKREVQHALLTAINIDKCVENGIFGSKTINEIIMRDEGLYGIDEVLAYGICNLYGSIALTNYGYIDKVKPGIIGTLNDYHEGVCNTFLDDVVGAIAAATASKLAHSISEIRETT